MTNSHHQSSFFMVIISSLFLNLLSTKLAKEELNIVEVVDKGQRSKAEILLEYVSIQEFNFSQKEISSRFSPFIDNIKELKSIKKFELSITQGRILFPSEAPKNFLGNFPKFGSSLIATNSSEKDFVKLSLLLSGILSYTNDRLAKWEKYKLKMTNSSESYLFSSNSQEGLCQEHIYKLRKFFGQNEFFNRYWENTQSIVNNEYSSITLSFVKKSTSHFYLKFTFRILYTKKAWKKFLKNRVNIKFERQNEFHSNYLRLVKNKYKQSLIKTEVKEELNSLDKILKENLNGLREIQPIIQEIKIWRRLAGPINKTYNKLAISIQSFNKDVKLMIPTIFAPTHRVALNLINLYHKETGKTKDFELTFRELRNMTSKITQPWSYTQIDITVSVKKEENLILLIPFGINLKNYIQKEHEFERGGYLEKCFALAYFDAINKTSLVELEGILLGEKELDNTLIFSSLTIGIMGNMLLYTSLIVLGQEWNRYYH